MTRGRMVGVLGCSLGIVIGIGVGRLTAQAPANIANKSEIAATVDLHEIELPGKVSVSRITIDEGNRMGVHKHDARSSIVIVVQGVIRETRGDTFKDYKVGDIFTVANQTTHFNANGGKGPAQYLEVNISNDNLKPTPVAAPTAAK